MPNELRPRIEHRDYITDELKATLDPVELQALRSMDSKDDARAISDYHGFPEIQISMIREPGQNGDPENGPVHKFLRYAETKEEKDYIISHTTVRATVTGPSDRKTKN